jgi:hypothetical protein
MILPILSHLIQDAVADFLLSAFPSANPFFATMLDRFLADPRMLFNGPNHSAKLPHPSSCLGKTISG